MMYKLQNFDFLTTGIVSNWERAVVDYSRAVELCPAVDLVVCGVCECTQLPPPERVALVILVSNDK